MTAVDDPGADDIKFARAREETTIAAHADGVPIEIATLGDDFNNTDDALTVTGAVTTYPDITFVVNSYIRIDDEVLKVTVVTADVTFARGQVGTTNVAHADGAAIEIVTTAGAAGPNVVVGNVTAGLLLINGNILAGRAGIGTDRRLRARKHLDEAFALDNEVGSWTEIGMVDLAGVTITNNAMGEGISLRLQEILKNLFDIQNYGKVEVGAVTVGMVTIEGNVLDGPQAGEDGYLDAGEILEQAFDIYDYYSNSTTIADIDVVGVSVSDNDIGAGGYLSAERIGEDLLELYTDGGSITLADVHVGPIAIDNNTVGGDLWAYNVLRYATEIKDNAGGGGGPATINVAQGVGESITFESVSVTGNQVTDGDLDACCIFQNALQIGESGGTVNLGPVVLGPVDLVGNTVARTDIGTEFYYFYAYSIFEDAAYTTNEPSGGVDSVTLGPVDINGNTLTSSRASPTAGDVGNFDICCIASGVGDGFDTPDFNGPVTLLDITFEGNTVMYGFSNSSVVSAGNLVDNDNPNVSYGDVYITLNNIQNNTGDGLKVGTNNADSALTIWVTRNTIANNSGYGVIANAPEDNIEVHHNNIYCNRGNCALVQAEDTSNQTAEWDGTDPFLGTNFGNYWGTEFYANAALLTVAITDSDGDGIGDTGGPEGDSAAPIDPPTASWDVFDDLPVMEFMLFPFELVFTQVGGAEVSELLSPQPVVEVRDAAGNLVVTDNLTQVQLSVTGGGAVLTCDVNPVTAVAGVAVFSGCSIDATGTQ